MAEDATLTELERDVEQSRARLAADIARLRAPETFETAKRNVMDAVRGYRAEATDRAQGGARSMLEDVKARAAANPAAAAAILAGVAWRLYRHPPIATALIGAGVAMLARTDPDSDRYRPRRIAEDVAQRLSAGARDVAERVGAQASDLTEGASEQARRLAETARDAGARVSHSVQGRSSDDDNDGGGALRASVEVHRVGDALIVERRIGLTRQEARQEARQEERQQAQRRDAYLLGFAALALGAAVGVARRRPQSGARFTQNGRTS